MLEQKLEMEEPAKQLNGRSKRAKNNQNMELKDNRYLIKKIKKILLESIPIVYYSQQIVNDTNGAAMTW